MNAKEQHAQLKQLVAGIGSPKDFEEIIHLLGLRAKKHADLTKQPLSMAYWGIANQLMQSAKRELKAQREDS